MSSIKDEARLQIHRDVNELLHRLQESAQDDGLLSGVNALPAYVQTLFPDWAPSRVKRLTRVLSKLGIWRHEYRTGEKNLYRHYIDMKREAVSYEELKIKPPSDSEGDILPSNGLLRVLSNDSPGQAAHAVMTPKDDVVEEDQRSTSPEMLRLMLMQEAEVNLLYERALLAMGIAFVDLIVAHQALKEIQRAKLATLETENQELKERISTLEETVRNQAAEIAGLKNIPVPERIWRRFVNRHQA